VDEFVEILNGSDGTLDLTGIAADGYHLMLVPTAEFGVSGDGPAPGAAEEPNWPRTVAVGVDVYPEGVNDLSLHWDGFELVNAYIPTNTVVIDDGLFHQAELTLGRVGNSTLATLVLTPDIYGLPGTPHTAFQSIVPLMLPYENRLQLGGRSGGLNLDIDLDNIQVLYTDPYLPVPTVSTPRLLQDFDRAGTTPFTVRQHVGSDELVSRPGVLPVDENTARGAFARLMQDGISNHRNSLTLALTGPSLAPNRRYSFDFRMSAADLAADGMGLLLLPTASYGGAGPGPELDFEKPNLPGTLGVGFALHPAENGVNDVSLHWNETEVQLTTLDPAALDLDAGVWHRAELTTIHRADGMEVTLLLSPDIDGAAGPAVTVADGLFIPGALPYAHRLQFGARSGGRFASIDLDNLVETTAPWDSVPGATTQDFEGGQSYYGVWQTPGGAGAGSAIRTGGPTGNYLHLIDDGQMNHQQALVFDATPQGTGVPEGQSTTGRLDFRAASPGNPADPADGFSVLLIPVDTYGNSGPGAIHQTGWTDVEKPNLPGVLGFAFALYPEGNGVNDCTLHWDSTEYFYARFPDFEIDLDAGVFHRLDFRVDWAAGGSTVSLVLTADVHGGASHTVGAIADLFVPGLEPYDFRVEVAARSGGSTIDLDIDNLLVQTGEARTSNGTPFSWLEGFGYTDNFENADLLNPDTDLYLNWQEYQLGYHPQVSNLPWTVAWDGADHLRFDSSSNRLYRVQGRAAVAPLAWDQLVETNGTGSPLRVPVGAVSNRIFRAEVRAP